MPLSFILSCSITGTVYTKCIHMENIILKVIYLFCSGVGVGFYMFCCVPLFRSWSSLKEVNLQFGMEGQSQFMKKVCIYM